MADLYRYYDSQDNLLYVGISICSIKRLKSHVKNSPWSADVSRMAIEKFNTREEALAAEAKAIREERPRFNVHHSGPEKPKPKRAEANKMNGLKAWRESKGWSQNHLANTLNKKMNSKFTQAHISAWENGTMPGADVGEAIRKLSKGAVTWTQQ